MEDIRPRDEAVETGPTRPSLEDVDTVVVPAWEDGFRDVFLGENRRYSIRSHASMRPQLKYIGVYQVAPSVSDNTGGTDSVDRAVEGQRQVRRQLRRAGPRSALFVS